MKFAKLNRVVHRWGSLLVAVPVLLVILTGLLLQLKKEVSWIQPSTQKGSSKELVLSFDEILEVCRTVPEAEIDGWGDIDRLDVRPSKGMLKVRADNRWEIQLDTRSGEVLQVAYRRSDLIETLHDGSFFHDRVKLFVFLPSAVILLVLWLTGIYLFVLPYLVRATRRRSANVLLLAVVLGLPGIHGQLGAVPAGFNYDESKVPSYTLPDPLLTLDGTTVSSAAEWPARRAEIIDLFAEHVYGRTPPAAVSARMRADVGRTIPDFLKGKATLKQVALTMDGHTLHLMLVVPNSAAEPVPAFIGLNFRGNHTLHPDPGIALPDSWMRPAKNGRATDHEALEKMRGSSASRWPLEMIIDRGFALASIYYGDIDPDFDDGFENGVHRTFGKPKPDEWGSIGTWAWGLSRGLDYLVEDPDIDGSKVAVFGHSRLGKTSLWAGASDPRFALVISNDSGCGGAALSRRAFGETVERINTSFPHWFCDNFVKYNANEAALPVDQHMLIALMAPRPVYVASAARDQWADPMGEFLAAKHAAPVYALFGMKGVGVETQPAIDRPVGDAIGYHLRSGKHDVTDFDWKQYLAFAARHFAD
jgi:hypothetical protein